MLVGISSDSLPATNQRTAYVALTRGKEQAVVFTDDKDELLKAMSKPDDPMSATGLVESAKQKPRLGLGKFLTAAQQLAAIKQHEIIQQGNAGQTTPGQELTHDR